MSPQGRSGEPLWSALLLIRALTGCWIAALIVGGTTGCTTAPETALERLSESRRLSADLLVQFARAGDAASRAVMADTSDSSAQFAREAEQATQAVQRDADTLRPILVGLGYSNEARSLEEFGSRFAEYRVLDRTILDLAVESSNLKAQRLSFGPAYEAADAFQNFLEPVAASAPTADAWRAVALAATAVAGVREMQALQAPHIAEADDAAMTRMEERMATAEAATRKGLQGLAGLAQPVSRPQLTSAVGALDRFLALNAEIVGLSRRNTNVRSLALSLGRKRTLTAACEDSLRALQDALATRGFTGTR